MVYFLDSLESKANYMKHIKAIFSLGLISLCLLALPTEGLASSIEFGVIDSGHGQPPGPHVKSQGVIDFQWSPVIADSGTPGDPINSESWFANSINVFNAIGRIFGAPGYQIQAGDSFTGLNYNVSMWLDQAQSTKSYDFNATMVITSIRFPDTYTMIIGGQLTKMLNQLTTSVVLSDLAAANTVDFTLNITGNSRTPTGGLISALNSTNQSSWANISGNVVTAASSIPEPGSILLFGSAAGLLGWWLWRKGLAKQETRQGV